jgi:hypothetical protein
MRTRWQTFLRELRKLVFGACCALGGLAGLWVAMWSVPEPQQKTDLGSDLSRIAHPVLVHLGIGLAAGTSIGLLICLTALKPRAKSGHYESGP